jgi:hypothetical protein
VITFREWYKRTEAPDKMLHPVSPSLTLITFPTTLIGIQKLGMQIVQNRGCHQTITRAKYERGFGLRKRKT